MIIAVDVGNSNVVVGAHEDGKWKHFWRLPTQKTENSHLFYDVEIRNLLLEHSLDREKVDGVILSAVVPSLRDVMAEVLSSIFDSNVVIVGPDLYESLSYKVPRPYEIGTDLVANAYSAHRQFGKACIVVDFGTALTFTTVDKTGLVLGVAIAPGIKTAMKALSSNTAQLPEIPLELPSSVVGLHTTHAMQAGILWGYVGMAKELITKIREEVGQEYIAIATGGLSFCDDTSERFILQYRPGAYANGLKYMLEDIMVKIQKNRMEKYTAIKERAAKYTQVLEQVVDFRDKWGNGLKEMITKTSEEILEHTSVKAQIEIEERFENLESITISLGMSISGIAENVDGVNKRTIIKDKGSLSFSQLFNGKVQSWMTLSTHRRINAAETS